MPVFNSRLEAARNENSWSDVMGTFFRSATEGLTADYVKPDDIPDSELPDMNEGSIKKSLTKVAGNVAGAAVTTSAASSLIVAPLIAALGVTGPFAPIIAGTVAAMGYSALQNTDLKQKGIGIALSLVGGGIAAKLKLNKLSGLAAIAEGEGAKTVQAAKTLGSDMRDLFGHNTEVVTDELKKYAAKTGVDSKSLPTVLGKFVQDFHTNPSLGMEFPETGQNISGMLFDEKGLLKNDWANTLGTVTGEVKDLSKKVIAQQALERGTQLQGDWEKSILGQTKTAIVNQLADPGNLLGKVPGGARFFQKADDAIFLNSQLKSAAGTYFEPVADKLAKIAKKNPEYYKDLSTRLSYALEDRQGAVKYLKDASAISEKFKVKVPEGFEEDTFKSFEGAWDFWKGALEKKGVPVLENYFTHTSGLLSDPKGVLGQGMPQEIAEAFFKERTGTLKDFVRDDITKVYQQYESHVSRKIAFDDLINDFNVSEKNPTVAKFLTGVVSTKRTPGGIIDWVTGMRYKNLVAYNPFSALSNLSQQSMAAARISDEGVALSKQLRKIDDPRIINFLNQNFSKYATDVIPEELANVKGKFDALKFFEKAEGRNWINTRSMGVAEELVQNPKYQKLVQGGMSKQEAVMDVLQDQNVWKRAMTRGADLASKTQFSMAKGMRPDLFETAAENPLLRIPLQFTRFQASNLESAINLFRPKGREIEILRRGFQDEANVVSRLQAMRTMASGAKDMLKKAVGDSDKSMLKALVQELETDSGFLKSEIQRIEPREAIRSAQQVGKMIVTGTAPKLARTWLKWGLVGYMFNRAVTPEKKAQDVAFGLAGQIPGLEMVRGMDLNPRYTDPRYGLVSTGTSLTPGLGMIDTLIPGRPITKAIYDVAFSKDHDIDESKPIKKQKGRRTFS